MDCVDALQDIIGGVAPFIAFSITTGSLVDLHGIWYVVEARDIKG